MNARPQAPAGVEARLQAFDWTGIADELDTHGSALLQAVLSPPECAKLARMYGDEDRFRSRVVMGRHGFGRGEYRYFNYPLPALVTALRDLA
ncbi:MAG: hypothetical protein ACTHJ9_07535 [Rhodanobacter sp.]